jgi:hypothetical protein
MRFLLYILIAPLFVFGQDLDYGNDDKSIKICLAFQGENFKSENSADTALDQILGVIGASKRFILQPCSNINNAIAITYTGVRYILYDPEFMSMLSYSNDWANMFILAHEVGHHINGHTVDALLFLNDAVDKQSLSEKRIQELEADEFAGFVLGRLGASLSDATLIATNFSNDDDSYSTHPSKSKRIAAITKGFNESGGKIKSNKSKGKIAESKYSNIKYNNVEYLILNDYYTNAVYKGTVSIGSGKPFGNGEIYGEDGTVYRGEMSGGKKNGYGVYEFSAGTYEGFFVNNHATGYARIERKNGVVEIGEFVDMVPHGEHKIIYPGGESYEGISKNGNFIKGTYIDEKGEKYDFGFLGDDGGNGFTTFTNPGGSKLTSFFENGKLKGIDREFSYGYINKKIKKLYKKCKKDLSLDSGPWNIYFLYIPTIVRNNLQIDTSLSVNNIAPGTYTWKDGRIYKGDFRQNSWVEWPQKVGYGELIYGPESDIKSYYGMWWDDKKNGYGVLTYKDGKIEKGIFLNNMFYKQQEFDAELMKLFHQFD